MQLYLPSESDKFTNNKNEEEIAMIYVMSDIHGEYEKYLAMLEKINFDDDDILYILGDVVDRGRYPLEILRDMKSRKNVYPIMGNHDKMALDVMTKLLDDVQNSDADEPLDDDLVFALIEWEYNGGGTTIEEFQPMTDEERFELLDYIATFSPYKIVNINDKTFILVHAGLGDFSIDKGLDEYSISDLSFVRFDYDVQYYDDDSIYIITGHTPTPTFIIGEPRIYYSHNNICIDCGATFEGGRLACLCLDTMEEFYT